MTSRSFAPRIALGGIARDIHRHPMWALKVVVEVRGGYRHPAVKSASTANAKAIPVQIRPMAITKAITPSAASTRDASYKSFRKDPERLPRLAFATTI
jgi:hypothetical protein